MIENNTITLSCPVTGKPEPVVDWYKDGELLTADNIVHKTKTGMLVNNDLRIQHAEVLRLL